MPLQRYRQEGYYPLARTQEEGLLAIKVDNEQVVYDLVRNKASCLNPTAAAVWQMCDGSTDLSQIAALLSTEYEVPLDIAKELGGYTLHHLSQQNLLVEQNGTLPSSSISRREMMRRIKTLGFAIALPVIYTITSPKPAAAQSVICGQICHHAQSIYCPPGCECTKSHGKGFCLPAFSF